jgi:hypothetical protein
MHTDPVPSNRVRGLKFWPHNETNRFGYTFVGKNSRMDKRLR